MSDVCVKVIVNGAEAFGYGACGLPVATAAEPLPFVSAGIFDRLSRFRQKASIRTRIALRFDGWSGDEIAEIMTGFTPALLDRAVEQAGAKPAVAGLAAEEDKGFFQRLLDAIDRFFSSELGQVVLQILKSLLLGLLVAEPAAA